MTTNRTPIQRRPTVQVTQRALDCTWLWASYGAPVRTKAGDALAVPMCERSYDLHNELHIELSLRALGMAMRRAARPRAWLARQASLSRTRKARLRSRGWPRSTKRSR